MKIGLKGQEAQMNEILNILPEGSITEELKINDLGAYDVVFDLDFDDDPEFLEAYAAQDDLIVVVGAVKVQIEEIFAVLGGGAACTFIGMNSLPSFINRELVEVSYLDKDAEIASGLFDSLAWNVRRVVSRVGMVTPRIVCMIINEAFFTVQEGTADRADIDLGMKLGTAYPKGPFEWCNEIGIVNVYETLHALYEDTKDERYKICPLLKSEYLQAMAAQ